MRVIAGRLKGRRLEAPNWEGLRPTSDRLRETLFNVLAPRIQGAHVLDAFAGTGAVGIEALSRGAAHVVFVEHDRRATELIRRNLRACAVGEGYTIVARSWLEAAASLGATPFNIAFLDPPYAAEDIEVSLAAVAGRLAVEGVAILEHAGRDDGADRVAGLHRVRRLASGDSALSFYVAEHGADRASRSGP